VLNSKNKMLMYEGDQQAHRSEGGQQAHRHEGAAARHMVTEITMAEPSHTFVRRCEPQEPQWRKDLASRWTDVEWLGLAGTLNSSRTNATSHPLSILLPRVAGASGKNQMLRKTRTRVDVDFQRKCL
jgi:hypothetical protein